MMHTVRIVTGRRNTCVHRGADGGAGAQGARTLLNPPQNPGNLPLPQAIKALAAALAPKARALRNGTLAQLDAKDLVPGDIILMAIGNIVPADVKLLGEEGDDIPMQVS